jgi:hypothetical protein
VETLRHRLAELLVGSDKLAVLSLLDETREWGIPESIAVAWAELHETSTLLDIARVQQVTAKPLDVVAPRRHPQAPHKSCGQTVRQPGAEGRVLRCPGPRGQRQRGRQGARSDEIAVCKLGPSRRNGVRAYRSAQTRAEFLRLREAGESV